jgi:glucuronate isomerase
MAPSIAAHPDRLLPAEPAVREIARSLYSRVAGLPIISPHGHVDAGVIEQNLPFPDPAALLVTPDHYVTRLIHAGGVPLDRLGLGASPAGSREVWRNFCAAWPACEGTASG